MEAAAKLALILAFAGVALVGYATLVVPTRREEARLAVARQGFIDAQLRDAPFAVCGKGRTGFTWRTRQAQGKVCVGGFLGPSVSVWR